MNKNHTRKQLEIQGHYLDDETLADIGPWMRWPYVLCSSLLLTAVALASPWLLWGLTVVATGAVLLPSHPFNYLYNHAVRRLTGTGPLPPSTAQGRFACGVASVWMIATGALFFTGATTLGYVVGGALVVPATLVATTHVCIPSMIYNALFNRKQAQPA